MYIGVLSAYFLIICLRFFNTWGKWNVVIILTIIKSCLNFISLQDVVIPNLYWCLAGGRLFGQRFNASNVYLSTLWPCKWNHPLFIPVKVYRSLSLESLRYINNSKYISFLIKGTCSLLAHHVNLYNYRSRFKVKMLRCCCPPASSF